MSNRAPDSYRNAYLKFRDIELSLNDHLAIDRTILANERTFLAYGRTALALMIIGGSCIKLFDALWIHAVGIGFFMAAAMLAGYGWRRYRRLKHDLDLTARDAACAVSGRQTPTSIGDERL